MSTSKPKLFIGSSSEGKRVAQTAFELLDGEHIEATLWSHDVFELSKAALESLLEATAKFDFALLVMTADDDIVVRGERQTTARDNVLFELGLFIGALGPARTLMLAPKDATLRTPSDLLGYTQARFDPERFGREPRQALAAACGSIERHVEKYFVKQEPAIAHRVAAICRRGSDRLLLVRTSNGRWTFPKGRVLSGESAEAAVLRIAEQKGGVTTGRVGKRLGIYEDINGHQSQRIAGYRVELEGELGEPREGFRDPRWCSREEARKLLRTGRSAALVDDMLALDA